MKGRLWWSSVLPLTATLCLTFAPVNVAKAQSGPSLKVVGPDGPLEVNMRSGKARRPGLIDPLCGLTGGPALNTGPTSTPTCESQDGREWEGIASTDYFSYEPSVFAPPNPDIAVGPDDILTIVNRTIARYPNPNAPRFDNSNGTASVPYFNGIKYIYPAASRQFLDTWLGESVLNDLCPTQPRSFLSCEISNASVRYDQMQGRFVVLYTVVDTGLVFCNGCAGFPTPITSVGRRKATWVLIVSRWATGCQGAGGGFATACVPNTTPAAPPLSGNTEFFTTAQPPGPSQSNPNSGGINGNWIAYMNAVDGTCRTGCPFGNINDISDLRVGNNAPVGAVTVDCNNTAIGQTNRVCYLPSSARLGLDNDNIIISSSVYDDNVNLTLRGFTITSPPNGLINPFAGTRLRVHKKAGFYTGVSSVYTGCASSTTIMCPGASQAATPVQGDFYDLYTNTPTDAYTFDRVIPDQPVPNGTRSVPGPHYEPEHIRGRSLASYNGNANLDNAFTVIWGAVNQGFTVTNTTSNPPQTLIYHRPITYTREPQGLLIANGQAVPATVDTPKIQGGIPALGARASHTVPQFQNPDAVVQRAKLAQSTGANNTLGTPFLYVGDDRPHRVIRREGHAYIASVVAQPTFSNFSATPVNATVKYDIVQKFAPTGAALEVYNTAWGNGNFFAPMHDTPANVVQYGSVSPVNVLPFLEKLFVGTTYPALAPTDARTANYGNLPGIVLQVCTGQDPGVTTITNRAYPGLFDMRCGEDAYDTAQAYRHPITGAFTPDDFQVNFGTTETLSSGSQNNGASPNTFPRQIVPFGTRGGAATDVNNMGLWLYGAYAKGRLAGINGFGVWGTYVAHYPLTFPVRDPYNNLIQSYSDVQPGHIFYPFVQIARQTEIDPGSRTTTLPLGVDSAVLRREMARWVVRAQMNEAAITAYLNSTGGIFCSFADVSCPAAGGTVTDSTGGPTAGDWRYIETMYRRGYTKGCDASNDGQRRFCPERTLTRGEMAVFIIRAKMNSVFPTVTSGAFTTSTCQPPGTTVSNVGDQFGLFVGCSPYFSDVPNTHIYFAFIQKLRELRISNGTALSTPSALGTYSPSDTLNRGQLLTFLVRGFFP